MKRSIKNKYDGYKYKNNDANNNAFDFSELMHEISQPSLMPTPNKDEDYTSIKNNSLSLSSL